MFVCLETCTCACCVLFSVTTTYAQGSCEGGLDTPLVDSSILATNLPSQLRKAKTRPCLQRMHVHVCCCRWYMDRNPAMNCSSCSAPSTLQCSRCHSARYCSKACQKAAWKSHKQSCTSPSAASTAAADAGPRFKLEQRVVEKPFKPLSIWKAAKKGVLSEISSYKGDANALDDDGFTPLAAAVYANQVAWASEWCRQCSSKGQDVVNVASKLDRFVPDLSHMVCASAASRRPLNNACSLRFNSLCCCSQRLACMCCARARENCAQRSWHLPLSVLKTDVGRPCS